MQIRHIWSDHTKYSLMNRDPVLLKAKDPNGNDPGWLTTLDVLNRLVLLN